MDKERYTTSEAASILNVAPSTLRYWESELENFLDIPRNDNGYRQYTENNIATLQKIRTYLYEQKYSIKQVREILNLEESKQDIAAALVGETDERLSSLVSVLLDRITDVEDGIKELKKGQNTLKQEYLQAVKLLNITSERRDRELIQEIRKRLDQKKEQHNSLLKRLLPWTKNND
ncbi:MerR family transcriptional regulator [Iocasia frigidifontis]|uniref:MerR family transcriptional regulator n=1 Tax=Iocasia fonsfrigidae TaxID=2682810 RepID=A0A8A7KF11_9FIRM|nr:MerR family transcriptional regulator [Iocasia fonsfrigidae]MTI61147.1 MerR family transcriptional regulator [Bacillota bacterium]QTL98268.1 MerR family transcriptional regulator [Iocasia fonsfrigidae]